MSDYAVVCRTCTVVMYEGDTAPTDAQVLLTNYANNTPCPVATCPHKTAAIEAEKAKRPVTRGDFLDLERRVTALEAKLR